MNGFVQKSPIVGRSSGINSANLVVQKYHGNTSLFPHLTKLVWKNVDFDDHGFFVLDGGVPNGDISVPNEGYYRFSAQISFAPDADRKSMYLLLHFDEANGAPHHVFFQH